MIPLKPFSLVENANRLSGLYWAIHPKYLTEVLQEVLWNVIISKVKRLLISVQSMCGLRERLAERWYSKNKIKNKTKRNTKSANIKYSLTQPSQRSDIYLERLWHGIKSSNCPSLLQGPLLSQYCGTDAHLEPQPAWLGIPSEEPQDVPFRPRGASRLIPGSKTWDYSSIAPISFWEKHSKQTVSFTSVQKVVSFTEINSAAFQGKARERSN